MTANCSVSLDIAEFLTLSKEQFTGLLKDKTHQTDAWDNELIHLQEVLQGKEGRVLFEFGIPGLPKVVDVILLLQNIVFVLEYKNWSDCYVQADIDQTNGYALRLKYFHSTSNDRTIVPILVATDALFVEQSNHEVDQVYDTALCNYDQLRNVIDKFCSKNGRDVDRQWEVEWEKGIYKASPTIIKAAINVWNQQNVNGLQEENGISSFDTRLEAEDYILDLVKDAEQNKRKAIVFVTGVPGAGKTLVGLNLSVRAQQYGASMLSGNGPLVEVLTAALRRNLDKQYKEDKLRPEVKQLYNESKEAKKQTEKDLLKNKISVDAILRSVYAYKEEIIKNRLNWEDKSYTLRTDALKGSQHVVIYDESQRAWTREKMLTPGQHGKKDWQDKESWPFSEPGILLWDLNQMDWGVFVCLVGGGQEIHDGEAGISEWLHTISESDDFNEWSIYMATNLTGSQYNQMDTYGNTVSDYCSKLQGQILHSEKLHLKEGQRTTRTGEVAPFIDKLIEGNATYEDYVRIKDYYHIYLTRNVEDSKKQLRKMQEERRNKGEVRIGMLMSSKGKRLRPLGYEDRKETEFLSKTPGWFLDSKDDNIDSSDYLEVALSEFFVQGLELDLCTVLWDADFRYDQGCKGWRYFNFGKRHWSEIKDETTENSRSEKTRQEKIERNRRKEMTRFYLRNAYRVLLTRARDGMVICVPEGDLTDDTREPAFYNGTYAYLQSLGFEEI